MSPAKTVPCPPPGYGAKVDAAIDSGDFSRGDFIRLALAALDQAGVQPCELEDAFQAARGDYDRIVDLLVDEVEGP